MSLPNSHAASCMKAADCPASNRYWNFSPGLGVRMATASAAPAMCPAHSPHCDNSFKTALSVMAMNRQSWLFFEDCDLRPAFRMARIVSSVNGFS